MIQTVDQLRGVALDQVLEKFGCFVSDHNN